MSVQAQEPFHFCTRMHLSGLTGLKAATLEELLALLKEVPGACVYYHTHRFLQQHQFLSPEPPNDFSYWVREVLGEEDLGERLASIDIMRFSTIRELREQLAQTIADYLQEEPQAKKKFARKGEEFIFIRAVSFIAWTPYYAHDLEEFIEALRKVSIDSIYFHIFESRLRLEKPANDFSYWLETSLGEPGLAQKIAALDPYTLAMEDLRSKIIKMSEQRLGVLRAAN